MFVFPFGPQEPGRAGAYDDISDKLKSLSYPLLFLSPEFMTITFEIAGISGHYTKKVSDEESCTFGDTIAEHVCLSQNDGHDSREGKLWLFSRLDDCRCRYSVVFFMDEEGRLRPVNKTAFCFFSTKEVTGLNFIIHAPFHLNDIRESIRADKEHNNNMVRRLADLAANAIVHLKEIGERESFRLINDNIIDIIPYNPEKFSSPDDKSRISFLPFYKTIKETFKKEEILPTADGYAVSGNAYWAAVPQLPRLFSNEQLSGICGMDAYCWVFTSRGHNETQHVNKELSSYISSVNPIRLVTIVYSKCFLYSRRS